MIERKPLAPNNRSGVMRNAFLQSLGPEAFFIKFPKANEKPSIRVYARRSQRQNGEGFGGGRVVGH